MAMGGKIGTVEIPHQRTRTPNEILTETELSIFRSEIGKLTWIARMARPDLMYDVFEAAQFSQNREVIKDGSGNFISKEEGKGD